MINHVTCYQAALAEFHDKAHFSERPGILACAGDQTFSGNKEILSMQCQYIAESSGRYLWSPVIASRTCYRCSIARLRAYFHPCLPGPAFLIATVACYTCQCARKPVEGKCAGTVVRIVYRWIAVIYRFRRRSTVPRSSNPLVTTAHWDNVVPTDRRLSILKSWWCVGRCMESVCRYTCNYKICECTWSRRWSQEYLE